MNPVRPAGLHDVQDLFAIRTAVAENAMTPAELESIGVTPDTVAAMLDTGAAAAWIGFDDGRPVGFSMARADRGDLFALFVLPEAEGCGLGARLLAEAERWLASRGVVEAWLLTGSEPGLRAPGFYAAQEWQDAGRKPAGHIRFRKQLRQPTRSTPPM